MKAFVYIERVLKSDFFQKFTLHHTCASCSKLPSYISTMQLPIYKLNPRTSDTVFQLCEIMFQIHLNCLSMKKKIAMNILIYIIKFLEKTIRMFSDRFRIRIFLNLICLKNLRTYFLLVLKNDSCLTVSFFCLFSENRLVLQFPLKCRLHILMNFCHILASS